MVAESLHLKEILQDTKRHIQKMLHKEQSQYVLRKQNILIMAVIHLCSLTHQLDQVIEKYQFVCSIEIFC